jgi:FixJ family two-component response regulator
VKKTSVISIVDDDNSVRVAMENLVVSMGFVARTFASAQEFLDSPHIETTSCLISDVQMPGLSGIDLQSVLLDRGHRFPIILITAYPTTVEQYPALKTAGACILQKPLDNQALIVQLENALRQRSG